MIGDANNFDDLTSKNIVEFLAQIFERRGQEEYLGEPVTMAEHMLQGAHLANLAGETETVIVATLLHDIGHFTSEFGMFSMQDTDDKYHETAGAKLLDNFFPPLVIDCIRFHVDAKRYLCAVDDNYHNRLSTASIHSLNLQGGVMSKAEVDEFEQQPHLQAIVSVRRYDDQGKVAGMPTPKFEHYIPAIKRVVDSCLAD
ncbi:MAG: HD domain-containing protein [Granulosicoccus sp.]